MGKSSASAPLETTEGKLPTSKSELKAAKQRNRSPPKRKVVNSAPNSAGAKHKVDQPLPFAPNAEPHWTEYFQCDKPSLQSTIDSPASPLDASHSPSRSNSPGTSDKEY